MVPMVFFFNFLFCIGVYPVNNVVIILGEQRRNSAIHVHASILPQTPLPCRLPHNIEQSPVLYSRSLLVILFFFLLFYLIILFTFGVLDLYRCSGYSLAVVRRLLIAAASPVARHRP